MSQPLIMSFRKDAADLCLSGMKLETRRIFKPEWSVVAGFDGAVDSIFTNLGTREVWRVGKPITIKRTRTGKGVGKVMCTSLSVEHIQDIDEYSARREGILAVGSYWENGDGWLYNTARDAFEALWKRMYRRGKYAWGKNCLVVVIGLEPTQ
jgi:hypothetical protein